jgi:hypothetical protein
MVHTAKAQGGCRKCCGQKPGQRFSLQAPVHTLHFIFRVKINFFDFPLFHMHHNVNGGVEHSHNIAHIEHTADRGRLDKQPNTVKGFRAQS